MVKITISLEAETLQFLDHAAAGNRSSYINELISGQRRKALEREMIAALLKDAEDQDYLEEIALWVSVVGDGINASE